MKPLTAEWVAKAEGDFALLERESRVRRDPNFDGVCFHAQQCAEKYLKARLCEAGRKVERIHDLPALLDAVLPVEPLWEAYRTDLAYLAEFAVRFRYPGETATKEMARRSRTLTRSFRLAARQSLRLA